jgi:chorismate mutase-like protein
MEDLDQLGHLRRSIDEIDGSLLRLLNERARLAQEIGKIKERHGRPVYAPERAEQLMRRLVALNKGPLEESAIRAIYREIMSASLALEKETVIAVEGGVAALTHLAAKELFGSCVHYIFPLDTAALFQSVVTGVADCGVIPFGLEGPDSVLLELLDEGKVFLCSQIVLGGKEDGMTARYLVLGTTFNTPSGTDQTALLFHLTDQPGALASALEPFRLSGVNVLTIHTRRSRACGLYLLMEVEGHAEDLLVNEALVSLKSAGTHPRVCGSFPRSY